MVTISRRRFLQLSAVAGGMAALGGFGQTGRLVAGPAAISAAEPPTGAPIKIGILDPLSSPYKTSSIHDVHGATVALDAFNKRGGVLGRPVTLIEADDASNVDTALKMATKLLMEDRVDVLMGTFNGDVALAVGELAQRQNKLFMVTGAHVPQLTGAQCRRNVFVFM